jgi:hypothetical protein
VYTEYVFLLLEGLSATQDYVLIQRISPSTELLTSSKTLAVFVVARPPMPLTRSRLFTSPRMVHTLANT